MAYYSPRGAIVTHNSKLVLLLLSSLQLAILFTVRYVRAQDDTPPPSVNTTTVVAFALPETGVGEDSSGYFKLSKPIQSAMRLAEEDVNALGNILVGNLSLVTREVSTAMATVKGLCDVLEGLGDIGTYGVRGFT